MRPKRAPATIAAGIRAHPRLSLAVVLVAVGVVGAAVWRGSATIAAGWAALRAPASIAQTGPSPRPTERIGFEEGCVSSGCHNTLVTTKAIHAPVQHRACGECHAPDAGGHRFPLVRAGTSLCTSCHAVEANHAAVRGSIAADSSHKGASIDGCLACHNPHGGSQPSLLVAESTAQTCNRCHAPSEGRVRHEPYAANKCGLCHDPHGPSPDRPTDSGPTAAGCATCHDVQQRAITTAASSHRQVTGSCLGCHRPHAGDAPGLLAMPSKDACLSCHPAVASTIAQAVVAHDAVVAEGSCVRCHDAHGSGHPGMLRNSERAVCLSCHDRAVTRANGTVVTAMGEAGTPHTAAGHDACSGCHTVHGGSRAALLRGTQVGLPLGPYDRENFTLCFGCHDTSLAEVASATDFRDGSRNLHALHLRSGDNSRGCTACHTVHADGSPRLMARTVRFEGSNWSMPMGFVPTPEGGRCGAACHEPLEYRRISGRSPADRPSSIKGGVP